MAFQIIRDDITKVAADAIVNTANPKPTFAAGTDAAIYKAAGADELLSERKKIGDIAPGNARYTPAFALDAKYIIHTVGPAWEGGDHGERETVRRCYENSLKLAEELGCESIAFPLIATGIYGFPKDEALQIAISVFSSFSMNSDMDITMVVFDKESFVLSGKVFSDVDAYIDENYVEDTLDEKGLDPVEIYKNANINRKHFSKINSNKNYQPKKVTAVAFAISMHLNLDETKDFLSRAGYALSPSSKFDLIVRFFIEKENYNMFEINEVLFKHGLESIGLPKE